MDDQFVRFAQFVNAQNRDDVLELTVTLKRGLHATRALVVLLAHILRVKHAARRSERVHCRVNTLFGNRTFQINESVQLTESRSRRRVRRVVCRDVNRLNGGDGPFVRRSNTLLKSTHFARQRRLVTHGGRHTAQKRGHFGTRLRETENIIDEEQNVHPGLIAEILRHRQGRKGNTKTRSRRLIHLTENHAGLVDHVLAGLTDRGFLKLEPKVVPFTSTLTHAGEHGVTAVRRSDSRDKFLNNDRLAQSGTAEQTRFTTADERRQKVNNFNTGFKNLRLRREVGDFRSVTVDR